MNTIKISDHVSIVELSTPDGSLYKVTVDGLVVLATLSISTAKYQADICTKVYKLGEQNGLELTK